MADDEIIFEEGGLEEVQRRLAQDPRRAGKVRDELLRAAFRPPLVDVSASLQVGEDVFEVVNIGPRGLGVVVDEPESLAVGEVLPAMEFRLAGDRFSLAGRVVHVSYDSDQGSWVAGIALEGLTSADEERLLHLVQEARHRYLAANGEEARS